nr:hypothetical protein [Tanacetum cinerariifolium]
MAAEENGDLPIPDLPTMEELCQQSLNGQGGPIAPSAIQATNFRLKNDMIQQSIKANGVTDDALRLSRADHTLLNDLEMAAEENGDLPIPDLPTMEELCQQSLNGH